jgi:hypothetical protein
MRFLLDMPISPLLLMENSMRYGRGFAKSNLYQMRSFYMAYRDIFQTVSEKSEGVSPSRGLQIFQTLSGTSELLSFQKVMASEYQTALPNEKELAAEIERTQALLQDRKRIAPYPIRRR